MLGLSDQAYEIIVRLEDGEQSETYASAFRRFGRAETWQQRMAFIREFQQNAGIIQRMMTMLSVLAAGIATAVLMYTNVQHKTRAIGILKALGGHNQAVLRLYVLEGVLLGIGGALV